MKDIKKLSKYLAGASALLSGASAHADIIYTDINPDSIRPGNNLQMDQFFFIDLNGDGVDDFKFGMNNQLNPLPNYNIWQGVWCSATNVQARSGSSFGVAVKTLNLASDYSYGSLIGNSGSFKSYGTLGAISYWSNAGSNGGFGNVGFFENQGDKYVGLKFYSDSTTFHYGWARVNVDSANYGFTLKDFAYQDIPEIPIVAGASTAILANKLNLTINDYGKVMQQADVSFNLAQADTTVSGYRLMIVKDSQASTFTVTDALNVPDSLYFEVSDTTTSYINLLTTANLDTDGDTLSYNNVGYRVFALSIPDGENSNAVALSDASDIFFKNILANTLNINVIDFGSIAEEAEISFNLSQADSTVSEYRLMVVKDANVASFTINDALAVSSASYIEVNDTVTSFTDTLTTLTLDTDGDALDYGTTGYRVFALSIPDGTNANTEALSTPSELFFKIIEANTLDVMINDFGDQEEEVEVSFNLSQADSTVSAYRLMVVKDAKAATFTAQNAYGIANTSYIEVTSSTLSFADTLTDATLDTDGDPIAYYTGGYRLFTLSIPDGTNANTMSLSDPSILFLDKINSIDNTLEGVTFIQRKDNLFIYSDNVIKGTLSLVDMSGKVLRNENVNENTINVDLKNYKQGLYVITIVSEDGKRFSHKLIR